MSGPRQRLSLPIRPGSPLKHATMPDANGGTYRNPGYSSQSQTVDCPENTVVPNAKGVIIYVRSF